MTNLLNLFLNVCGIAGYRAAGMAYEVAADAIIYKRWFAGFIIGFIVLFIIAVAKENTSLAFGSIIALGVILLLAFDLSILGIKIISWISGGRVNVEEASKIAFPFRTVALSCAFIGTIIAIRGLQDFSGVSLWVIIGLALFFTIFDRYLNAGMIYAWILLVAIIVLVIIFYLTSVQSKSYIDLLGRESITAAVERDAQLSKGDLLVLFEGIELYDEDRDVKKIIKEDVEAKIDANKTLGKNKESYYKIYLASSNGDFTSDEEYYIPTRKAEELLKYQKKINKKNKEVEDGNVSNVSNRLKETLVGEVPRDNTTICFTAEKPFPILVAVDGGLITDMMPAGESFRHFDYAGAIRVDEEGRDDIKIIRTVKGKPYGKKGTL